MVTPGLVDGTHVVVPVLVLTSAVVARPVLLSIRRPGPGRPPSTPDLPPQDVQVQVREGLSLSVGLLPPHLAPTRTVFLPPTLRNQGYWNPISGAIRVEVNFS